MKIEKIDIEKMPTHIGIIMDGNRTWAKERNLDAKLGHKHGAETLENIVRYANKIGLKYLTVYAFSTENWNRTKEEVGALMILLQNYLNDFLNRADTENIQIKVLGDLSQLSKGLQTSINKAIEKTKKNTGIIFNIAFNYGGRMEITNALKNIAKLVEQGKLKSEDINENIITDNLYTAGIPDPDIIIRTSGQIRTSNFLPWQSVYAEYIFLEKNWPDFTEEDLLQSIYEYQNRLIKKGK